MPRSAAARIAFLSRLSFASLCLFSCGSRLDYLGEIGRGILPQDEDSAPYACLAAPSRSSRLYVRLPIREGDESARGQVLRFSRPGGAPLGAFRDDRGREDGALRITATPQGELAVLRSPEAASGSLEYELSLYGPDEKPSARSMIGSPYSSDSEDRPYAVGLALTETGAAALAWADPYERELGGIAIYGSPFSSERPEPSLRVGLEEYRERIPVAAEGYFRIMTLCYAEGFFYAAIDMSSESFDGVLVLDRDLRFVRYITGDWAFNSPVGIALDEGGLLYVSNRWEDNIVAYKGERLVARSAKDNFHGQEGLLTRRPGSIVFADNRLYAYDAGNGRIVAFSPLKSGPSADRARMERILRPIVPRYASDGGFDALLLPFMLGCFAILALHGFLVGSSSRERSFVLLGLVNLCALVFFIERSYSRFFIDLDDWDLTMGLYIGALVLFLRDYIRREGQPKWMGRSLGALGIAALASTMAFAAQLAISGGEPISLPFHLSDLPALAAICLIVIVLAYESARGNRAARVAFVLNLVLFASGFLSIGIFDFEVIEGAGLESAFLKGYPLMLGCLLNSLILSLDLGSRLASLKAERQREEAENHALRELDRQKTDFIMNVSHELRTPLSVIIGVADRMGRTERAHGAGPGSGDEDARSLDAIKRNAKKLKKDIDNLLALSSLELRAGELRTSSVRLGPFLSTLAAEFSALAQARGLRLELGEIDPGLRASADPELLETAVQNLVSNAIKFTPPGGSVSIGAAADATRSFARIEVRDSGIGVEPELRERIFARFFRAEGGSQRKYEGSGIGLALVREIAELHEGRAEVESESGRGSTFTLLIPLGRSPLGRAEDIGTEDIGTEGAGREAAPAAPEAAALDPTAAPAPAAAPNAGAPEAAAAATSASAAPRARPGGSVLIVEDNDDLRETIAGILSGLFEVRAAANGREALKAIEERRPDCVVSDVMMPVMDGHELFRAVRAGAGREDLPFVFLTARADRREKEKALRDGALDYIEKPFSPAELRSKVENLIALKREVSARIKARLKDSIADLIDSIDEGADVGAIGAIGAGGGAQAAAPGASAPRAAGRAPASSPGRPDYESLFKERGLSDREAEIARLILSGSSDKEIAYALGISASTVANHNGHLYKKLGVAGRVELLTMAAAAPATSASPPVPEPSPGS